MNMSAKQRSQLTQEYVKIVIENDAAQAVISDDTGEVVYEVIDLAVATGIASPIGSDHEPDWLWDDCDSIATDVKGILAPHIGTEAKCPKCGETFNPNPYDGEGWLEHYAREDGTECGGLGTLTGTWG